jgi:hypothetical protein
MKRQKYVRAMMNAIGRAQKGWLCDPSSKTDALRAIRRFEEVNGVRFNPFNESHVGKVSGCGTHEHFFRAGKVVIDNV